MKTIERYFSSRRRLEKIFQMIEEDPDLSSDPNYQIFLAKELGLYEDILEVIDLEGSAGYIKDIKCSVDYLFYVTAEDQVDGGFERCGRCENYSITDYKCKIYDHSNLVKCDSFEDSGMIFEERIQEL
jgi:hypothetical protein